MSAAEIAQFLEDFMRLHGGRPATSKLISLKVPEDLLGAFRAQAKLAGVPYQSQIKRLMRSWVDHASTREGD
jgi:uncharacterized protein (DUF4415 family)